MQIHIVRPGDTLTGIARQYSTSVARLLTDNGLSRNQTLAVGQALIILLPEVVHTVRPGETLTSIGAAYGVTPLELIQNNPTLIQNPVLQPGQLLTVSFQAEKGRELTILGYAYPFINRNVLRRALPYLTYLSVFSYGFRMSGELLTVNDETMLRDAAEFDVAPVLVLTAITEDGGFSSEKVSAFLNDPALQSTVLDNILNVMDEKGYVGMEVDFEYIPWEDAEAYQNFLRLASERLGAAGYFLSVDLAPKVSGAQAGLLYEAHDYPAIGAIADLVHVMTYEWELLAHRRKGLEFVTNICTK